MTTLPPVPGAARVTTRRFALSAAERVTTAGAAVVSTGAYLTAGYPYLARGVVGDLLGFAVLGVGGVVLRARLRHEAVICLLLIGLVLAIDPQWPLGLPEPAWWTLFLTGLTAYVVIRRRLCE